MPATCPYPEPARSSPYPHIPLPEDPSSYYPLIYACAPCALFPSRFPIKTLYTSLLFPICATFPASLILLHFITRTIFGDKYRSLSSSLCSFLHSPITSSLSDPNIPLNTLFWNTLSLRSSHNVNDQVSHPYKTTGKITILYILIFNPLTPKDDYSGRTVPLTSKLCILYIYSTNIVTEYFKHDIYSPFFPLQNAVCFINLTYLVPVLFIFYIQDVLKLKNNSAAKRLNFWIANWNTKDSAPNYSNHSHTSICC